MNSISDSQPLFNKKQLLILLWPLLVEQLLNVLVGMVDVVMVSSLGEAAVSGVALVDALNQLLIQFLAALATGGTVVCSQFIGMKRLDKANESAGQLIMITCLGASTVMLLCLLSGRFLLALVFGGVEVSVMENANIYFLITAFSFPFLALYNSSAALFRASGNSQISMRVSLLMNGMNVALNALCIYILHMGVSGVAIPTLISRVVASLLLFYLLQKPENTIRVSGLSDFKPNGTIIRRILSIGIPGGVESSMFQLGKLMLQSLVSSLGTSAIASYAVAGNLVMFLYLPGNALGIGQTTVVGQCVGANEPKQAKRYARTFVILNYLFLAALATGMTLFRYSLIGIYHLTPEAVTMASGLVLSHSIAMIIWPLAFQLPYALRAANDAKFTMIMSITVMWIFRVMFAYIFVKFLHKDIQYIWYAMYLDWIARVIILLWRFRGYTDRIQKLNLGTFLL